MLVDRRRVRRVLLVAFGAAGEPMALAGLVDLSVDRRGDSR
jgi:hypothetical protein